MFNVYNSWIHQKNREFLIFQMGNGRRAVFIASFEHIPHCSIISIVPRPYADNLLP